MIPQTIKKLTSKETLKLCISGDSISEGYNASKFTNTKPFVPSYSELVSIGLRFAYNSKIELKNMAKADSNSTDGAKNAKMVALENPDLVILAFGMNDSHKNNPEVFINNIESMISQIKSSSPNAEFIVVSSMLPNEEWHGPIFERFALYSNALEQLSQQGIIFANLTAMWQDLLKHKRHHDLIGNGVNHPNDFGHRIYAQAILSLLIATPSIT